MWSRSVRVVILASTLSFLFAGASTAGQRPLPAKVPADRVVGLTPMGEGGGTIRGRVTTPDGAPIAGLPMLLYDGSRWYSNTPDTDANGEYVISGIPDGTYFLNACDCGVFNQYVDTWYPNVWDTEFWRNLEPATPITVRNGTTLTADFRVPLGARLRLHLRDGAGQPIRTPTVTMPNGARYDGCYGSMWVEVRGRRHEVAYSCAFSRDFDDGTYEPYVVPQGRNYFVQAWPGGTNFVPVWYERSPTINTATPIRLTEPGPRSITIVLAETGKAIRGRMTFATPAEIRNASVIVYRPDGTFLKQEPANPDGTYAVMGLPSGEYVVYFLAFVTQAETSRSYSKYYPNATSFSSASIVSVGDGDRNGVDVVMDTPANNAALRTNTRNLNLIAPSGGTSESAPISIWTDTGEISWEATSEVPWLRLSPSSGRVSERGGARTISVSADAATLAPGRYTATVTITGSNGAPLNVPVVLEVTAAPSPEAKPIETSVSSLHYRGELSQFEPQTIVVHNPSAVHAAWNLRSTIATAYPPSGELGPGKSAEVSIAANVSELEFGSVNGLVDVLTNGRVSSTIRVTVSVSPKPVPVDRFGSPFEVGGVGALVTPVPPSQATVVPAVASRLAGNGGSMWTSDVFLSNLPSALRSNLSSFILSPFGSVNGAGALMVNGLVKLPAIMIASPLASLFRVESGMGALDVRPETQGVASWSRIWTAAKNGRGTFGQEIPAFDASTALKAGESGVIPVVLGRPYRTNMLFSEISGAAAIAHVEILDDRGNPLTSHYVGLQPFEQRSLGGVLPQPASVGYARVSVSGSGAVGIVTTLVDNVTNDPTTVLVMKRAPLTSSGRLIVPGIARAAGANNTTWRSDVWLVNSSNTILRFTPVLYQGGAAPPLRGSEYVVGPHAQVTLSDSIRTDFGMEGGRGALMLDVTAGDVNGVRMISRTFNLGAGGSLGNGVRAVEIDDETGSGDTGLVLFGMQRNREFRTNLQIQETTGNSAIVELSATATRTDAPGTTLATATTRFEIKAYEFYQVGDVLGLLGLPQEAANARLIVRVVSGSGRVVAYGSMVDNVTGDPTTVPAFRVR